MDLKIKSNTAEKKLCQNIQTSFSNFEQFQEEVTRTWLLEQKGIGEETADAILCYACKKKKR